MQSWPVQDAKARFSEMLETCLSEGPQRVTRRGQKVAVLVSEEEWERKNSKDKLTLKEWLLSPKARGDLIIPPRVQSNRRPAPKFD
jgi:antitoxin Phd